ncbi:MAG: galactokinase family protein [Promethearchaeota archaeon]
MHFSHPEWDGKEIIDNLIKKDKNSPVVLLLNMQNKGYVSSPGRICLFGEHQDYLGLPVIPMAINKRLKLYYQLHKGSTNVKLQSHQLNQVEKLILTDKPQITGSPYDYLKAALLYFWEELNLFLPSEILIDSSIPIRAGMSSSAALLTTMVFLISNLILKYNFNEEKIAEIAYFCEHDILGISCGRMDQYACSLGGIFYMTSQGKPEITPIYSLKNVYFIIANSGVKRKADIPLKKVQQDIFQALKDFNTPKLNDLTEEVIRLAKLSQLQQKRLLGVIGIRDNTQAAFEELKRKNYDLNYIGRLLTEQQYYLKENYKVSHPKLDVMCKTAIDKGALGAKLTGAGFGGCMFALAVDKENAIRIREALHVFGDSFIVQMDTGVTGH